MDYFYIIAIIGSCLIMALAFWIEQKTLSSGHIDSIWSLNVGFFGFIAAIPFHNLRASIIAALIAIWAIRLGGHIFVRTQKLPEDPRYSEIKKSWGKNAARNLFWFLQIQAICAFVLICAIRLGITKENQSLQAIDVIALMIAICGIIGEAIADNQLRNFKEKKPPKSICNIGLWKLSRHPNYFFEFVFWLGISFFALDFANFKLVSLLALSAPLMMYYLLNYASGIPPLESYMLKSRGKKFEEYMQKTRPFFPFPK